MADPFEEAFDQIGDDFETLMPGLAPVAVASLDPDTGETLDSAEDVPALKRVRRRSSFAVGGGEVGSDQTRFLFAVARVAFELKPRDTVTDADGTVWLVDERGAESIAKGQLWAVNVNIQR